MNQPRIDIPNQTGGRVSISNNMPELRAIYESISDPSATIPRVQLNKLLGLMLDEMEVLHKRLEALMIRDTRY